MPVSLEETFATEHSESDLPDGHEIPLRAAVCWHAGLPRGSLDDLESSDPRHTKRLGRVVRSAKLWKAVLAHVVAISTGEDSKFPWNDILEDDAFKSIPQEPFRTRTEIRFREAMTRAVQRSGIPGHAILHEVRRRVSHEITREWAIRDSLHAFARDLHRLLLPGDSSATVDTQIPTEGKGLCLSLRTSAVDRVDWPGREATNFVELWRRTKSYEYRTTILPDCRFNRRALLEIYLHGPNRIRDAWRTEVLETPEWSLDLALSYVRYAGDLDEVWRSGEGFRAIGYADSRFAQVARDTGDPIAELFEGARPSAVERTEVWLRQGKLVARGIRHGSDRSEPIPAGEWHALRIGWDSLDSEAHATAKPRARVRWDCIVVDRSALVDLVPTRAGMTAPTGAMPGEIVVAPDTDRKRAVLRLAKLMSENVGKMTQVELRELFGMAEIGEPLWVQHYFAAKILLPQWIVDQWERRGPRPKQRP